jgi:hypothetical protein
VLPHLPALGGLPLALLIISDYYLKTYSHLALHGAEPLGEPAQLVWWL